MLGSPSSSGSSVVLAAPPDSADDYYQPPVIAQRVLSVGLNSHTLLQPGSTQVTQAERIQAEKRARQAAFKAQLDADRVATIPTDRRAFQMPSPKIEATGFLVGRQRIEETPIPKHEQFAMRKSELDEAKALPPLKVDRRPFPHRAYTPNAQLSDLVVYPQEDDEATKAAKHRAEVRKNLQIRREDVIAKLNNSASAPSLSPAKQQPVGGKAAAIDGRTYILGKGPHSNSGLAIGPDVAAEKAAKMRELAAFQATVRRDLYEKEVKRAETEARNLAILMQARGEAGGASLPKLPSPSKLKDAYVDENGFTTIQIGGETSDVIRGKTAFAKKRAQQQQYFAMLNAQQRTKNQHDEAMSRSHSLASLDREGATALTGFMLGPDDELSQPDTSANYTNTNASAGRQGGGGCGVGDGDGVMGADFEEGYLDDYSYSADAEMLAMAARTEGWELGPGSL